MSDQPTLRLAQDHPAMSGDVYKFDRRHAPRRRTDDWVTALINPGEDQDHPKRICSLRLCDVSDDGVGAWSQEALKVGQRLVLFFPEQGPEHGFDAYGEVTQCTHDGQSYRIGVHLDPPQNRQSA